MTYETDSYEKMEEELKGIKPKVETLKLTD